jgi:hypothetical protein
MSRTKLPVIMIDLDGVLVDFTEAFTRTAKGLDPSQKVISTVSQPSWNLEGLMDKKLVNATWDRIRATPEWWDITPWPLFDAREMARLRHFQAAYEVVFCTNRNARSLDGSSISTQSIRWLERHGIREPSLVVAKDKHFIAQGLPATHAIDDRISNVLDIHQYAPDTKVYIMDRPYNRAPLPDAIQRVSSLGEFFDCVEKQSTQTKLDKQPSEIRLFVSREETDEKRKSQSTLRAPEVL